MSTLDATLLLSSFPSLLAECCMKEHFLFSTLKVDAHIWRSMTELFKLCVLWVSARVTVCVFCLESLTRNGLTTCFHSVWLISIPLFHEISWRNDQEWLPYFPTWSNLPENLCHEAKQKKPQLNHNDTTSFVTTMVLSGKPSTPWLCNPETHLTKQKSPQLFCANLGQIICPANFKLLFTNKYTEIVEFASSSSET